MHDHAAAIPRVVLDTNVSLALFAYADASCAALLAALREQRLQAVTNPVTRAEWLRVLGRDELKLSEAMRSQAARQFDALVIMLSVVPAAPAVFLPLCRDPDDQKFLELARDASATTLYSRDRELLKLSRRTERMAGFVVLRPEDCRD